MIMHEREFGYRPVKAECDHPEDELTAQPDGTLWCICGREWVDIDNASDTAWSDWLAKWRKDRGI